MPKLTALIRDLRRQRNDVQTKIDRLDTAISALSGVDGSRGRRGGRRRMSAASRKRIAAGQRARWAKWKQRRRKAS